jgi:hypothetical protein
MPLLTIIRLNSALTNWHARCRHDHLGLYHSAETIGTTGFICQTCRYSAEWGFGEDTCPTWKLIEMKRHNCTGPILQELSMVICADVVYVTEKGEVLEDKRDVGKVGTVISKEWKRDWDEQQGAKEWMDSGLV